MALCSTAHRMVYLFFFVPVPAETLHLSLPQTHTLSLSLSLSISNMIFPVWKKRFLFCSLFVRTNKILPRQLGKKLSHIMYRLVWLVLNLSGSYSRYVPCARVTLTPSGNVYQFIKFNITLVFSAGCGKKLPENYTDFTDFFVRRVRRTHIVFCCSVSYIVAATRPNFSCTYGRYEGLTHDEVATVSNHVWCWHTMLRNWEKVGTSTGEEYVFSCGLYHHNESAAPLSVQCSIVIT